MPAWLLIVLLILTVYRATRFVIADTFPPIGVPRTHFLQWLQPDDDWVAARSRRATSVDLAYTPRPHLGAFGRSLHYLFTCPWCMSMWLGAGIIWAVDAWFVGVPMPVLVWASASAITGLLSGLEEKLS